MPLEIVVVDNASSDGTPRHPARASGNRIRIIYNDRNLGFAEAQNQAIRASTRRMGADAQSGRAAAARLHPHAGGRRAGRSGGRRGLRKAAFHRAGIQPAGPSCASIPRASTSPRPCAISTAAGTSPMRRSYDTHGVRLRRQRRGRPLPARDDRRCGHGRRLLRPGFLRLPRGCRRGLARPVAWAGELLYAPAAVAYHVRTRDPGQPPRRCPPPSTCIR